MVREASPLQGVVTWPMLTWQTEQGNAVNNSKSLRKSVRHWCSHSHTAEHPLLVWHPANNPELSYTNPNSVAFYSAASVWPQPLLFQHLIYSGHAGWGGHKSNWLLTLHSRRGKLQISNCAMLKDQDLNALSPFPVVSSPFFIFFVKRATGLTLCIWILFFSIGHIQNHRRPCQLGEVRNSVCSPSVSMIVLV